jgi:hypothetical protein
MQGWGYQLEEDFGKKWQRWVVTRDSAWRYEHDDCNIALHMGDGKAPVCN